MNSFKRIGLVVLLVAIANVQLATAQDAVDSRIVAKIRAEGFQRSKIMPAVQHLSDVFGPRLTNSPNIKKAQAWTSELMKKWGLENVSVDPWGEFGTGWEVERYSVEMTSPTYDRLNAMPLAWTPGTNGVVSGEPVLVNIRSSADFDKYRGKLSGKIVMNGEPGKSNKFLAPAKRLKDGDLKKSTSAIDPFGAGMDGGKAVAYQDEDKDWQKYLKQRREVIAFLKAEGVAVMLQPSAFPYGIVRASGFYETDRDKNIPAFIIGKEQYGRMVRLRKNGTPVNLKIDLSTRFTADKTGYNVIGEIPGTDPKLKDQIVMLGGHFDSWHGGTGAADNGANCIVMMEALRILKAIGVKPKRTIRVALWSGEEQDYFGSYNYVKNHFGDPKTGSKSAKHGKLSAYFNLDNGGGRIRGIFLQGNEGARSIFNEYLKPFGANGSDTMTILNTGGTDHMVFDGIGLPGFQFIQDPLDYNSRVHHSNMDVYESVVEDDLKLNAVIVAVFAYHTAMRGEMIPRK
jgi:hypothetical protein